MKVTKIKMRRGCEFSDDVLEIDSLYIPNAATPAFYKKEKVHEYLKEHPGTIYVDHYPFPDLIPATSPNGEKYVRSEPNETIRDNLLELPRE